MDLIQNSIQYVDIYIYIYIKPINICRKWLGMVGEWLGCIQPMCSKPWHSWQGPSFFCLQPLFIKMRFLIVFMMKHSFYTKKGQTPGASLDLEGTHESVKDPEIITNQHPNKSWDRKQFVLRSIRGKLKPLATAIQTPQN